MHAHVVVRPVPACRHAPSAVRTVSARSPVRRAQTAIFGDGETEPSKDTAVSICLETCRCGLPTLLANKLALLDFEARKDAAQARARLCSLPHPPLVKTVSHVAVCRAAELSQPPREQARAAVMRVPYTEAC